MLVSHEDAERLMRQWWPNPDVTKADMARHFGVTRAWVHVLARRAGMPDLRAAEYRIRMPVMVRGQRFDDAAACAAHFGLHVQTIRTMICRGKADRIGLGQDRSEANWNARAKPFALGPFHWPSRGCAAKALGYRPCKFSRLIGGGRMDEIMARAMHMQIRQERAAA